ncbi:MAG TPA: hypothetical protein VKW77_01270 [Acidimicrobiales bacterium]|nr:hypothetical protein [Acidimicrobiales bacterium]
MVADRYPEVEVDGFLLVMFVSYGTHGEALVRGPDGGIATLIWSSGEPAEFRVLAAPGSEVRWGSYSVQLPLPLTTDGEAAAYLRAILPELRPRWEAWRRSRRLRPAS